MYINDISTDNDLEIRLFADDCVCCCEIRDAEDTVKLQKDIQSTALVISLISNDRLSRSENLVPIITQRSTNRQENIVEKRRYCSLGAISSLLHNSFNILVSLT